MINLTEYIKTLEIIIPHISSSKELVKKLPLNFSEVLNSFLYLAKEMLDANLPEVESTMFITQSTYNSYYKYGRNNMYREFLPILAEIIGDNKCFKEDNENLKEKNDRLQKNISEMASQFSKIVTKMQDEIKQFKNTNTSSNSHEIFT